MIKNINPKMVRVTIDTWQHEFLMSIQTRSDYQLTESSLQYSQVHAVVLGTPLSEDAYLEMLFELAQSSSLIVLSEQLDKTNNPKRFQAVQRVLLEAQRSNLSINRLLAFMDGENLIPFRDQPQIYYHLLNAYKTMLMLFHENHEKDYANPDFRRVLIDSVKWLWNHLEKWIEQIDFFQAPPKIVWYGEAQKSEAYFLYLLKMIGCDVVVFLPNGKNFYKNYHLPYENEMGYPKFLEQMSFPKQRPLRRSTLAYRASQEMNEILHHDQSLLFKPWQLRNHLPAPITLKTTYDEVFLIAKEKAMIRPNFSVAGDTVYVPNLFAKVLGVSEDRKQYAQYYRNLVEASDVIEITTFPFAKLDSSRNNMRLHYQQLLSSNGKLDANKLIESHLWKYAVYPNGMQFALAEAIARYCEVAKLKPIATETREDVVLFLFKQAMQIPVKILDQMQQFDYSQEIPKLIIRSDEDSQLFTRADAALCLLLNELCWDIIIYNQYGKNDIEMFVEEHHYDAFWQEEMMNANEEDDSGSSFKRFLSRIF